MKSVRIASRGLLAATGGVLALAAALLCHAGPAGADGEELVALPLELPKPALVGTPKDVDDPQYAGVEKVSDKRRPVPKVPKGTTNLALHKTVTSNAKSCFSGELPMITDGNKEATEDSVVEIKGKPCWVQIDLEASHELSYICIWHYHREWDVVHHVIVQVSDDPKFETGVTTLFNNDKSNKEGFGEGANLEYWETYEGKLIPANGVKGRYVRLYSNGDTIDKLNRYTEVEVYGL
jgi:hypothetical protein